MKIFFIQFILINFAYRIIAQKNNFVSLNGFTSINAISPFDNTLLLKHNKRENEFDINNVISIFKKDISAPKFNKNSTDFGIAINLKECNDFLKSKYDCITISDKNFNTMCNNLNEGDCRLINTSYQYKMDLVKICETSINNIEQLVDVINKLIKAKEMFCIKKDKDSSEFCPITKALQQGYLNLIRETESTSNDSDSLNNNTKVRRGPIINSVNSYIGARGADMQIVNRNLKLELINNCNYTICHTKTSEYIKNIRDEYSYFKLLYKYKINDDTLQKSLLKTLECSSSISIKYLIHKSFIFFMITLTILFMY